VTVRRRLFNLAAAVSLVLCVGTVALWVRSYSVVDVVGRYILQPSTGLYSRVTLGSAGGSICCTIAKTTGGSYPTRFAEEWAKGDTTFWKYDHARLAPPDSPSTMWERIGFVHHVFESDSSGAAPVVGRTAQGLIITVAMPGGTENHRTLGIPHWVFVLALLVLPLLRFLWVRRQNSRAKQGCCIECGYDLRATPDRCPECGAEAKRHRPKERPRDMT
jgi:hypothetical protein